MEIYVYVHNILKGDLPTRASGRERPGQSSVHFGEIGSIHVDAPGEEAVQREYNKKELREQDKRQKQRRKERDEEDKAKKAEEDAADIANAKAEEDRANAEAEELSETEF
jgi:hypothetical protein